MSQDLNQKVKDFRKQSNQAQVYKASTFTPVRESKTAPVQVRMDKELPHIIGSSFLLIAIDKQKTQDQNGESQAAAVYTVRVISKKALAFRDLIQIKVKNANPIVSEDELDRVMLQQSKPIILRFDAIAHYAYMGGETLNAASVERLHVSVQEAMNHE